MWGTPRFCDTLRSTPLGNLDPVIRLFEGNFLDSLREAAQESRISRRLPWPRTFRAYFALILRPASWLALLSRTFTFELALAGSPRTNVEYDYVGKQSIPTTGLSPASPTALWAAVQELRRYDPRGRL